MDFTKTCPDARAAQWEAVGLRWLAEADGARIVEVLGVDGARITERRVASGTPTADAAERFGQELATTHLAGAAGFGLGPDDWQGDGLIGPIPLPMADPQHAPTSWGEFYAEFRVLPFARQAVHAGDLSSDDMKTVERVCQRLRDGDFDDGRPPSRVHGDLWSGNVLFSADGVVLIDAAAHGGHAETDLAMLDLFGVPQQRRIEDAWAEAYRPADGWRERTGLHQLHPLLVHTVLFGGSYGRQAGQVARRFT